MTSFRARVSFVTAGKRHRVVLDPFTVTASSLTAAAGRAARVAVLRWKQRGPRRTLRSIQISVEIGGEER